MKKLILIGLFSMIGVFGALGQRQVKESIENKLKLLEKQSGKFETDSIFCYIRYESFEHFHGFSMDDTVGVVLDVFKEHFKGALPEDLDIYVHTWKLSTDMDLKYYNVRDKAVFRIEVVEVE